MDAEAELDRIEAGHYNADGEALAVLALVVDEINEELAEKQDKDRIRKVVERLQRAARWVADESGAERFSISAGLPRTSASASTGDRPSNATTENAADPRSIRFASGPLPRRATRLPRARGTAASLVTSESSRESRSVTTTARSKRSIAEVHYRWERAGASSYGLLFWTLDR
jgi:ABC-type nitrate/sulfonate/bicarbonate transport system substrate-binding protein